MGVDTSKLFEEISLPIKMRSSIQKQLSLAHYSLHSEHFSFSLHLQLPLRSRGKPERRVSLAQA
jgi:hypothetical protein